MLPVEVVVDPWSGELFRFKGEQESLPSDVMLTTIGPNQIREVYVEMPSDPHGSNKNSLTVSSRDLSGVKHDRQSNDRLHLEFVDGRMRLRLPHSPMIAHR